MERNEYYTIKTILNKYYNAINYLEADINELGIVDIESETDKNKVIEEYNEQGIKILEDILDKECIEYLKLNKENIIDKFLQYKNYYYTIKDMYTVQKNINTNLYYVIGLLNDEKEYKLIIKTDSYTQTFSIYSQEYIESKQYNEKSIEEEFNIKGIEYIEKNSNNQYVVNNITDKIMAQYYLYNYGEAVSRNIENAYKMLDEEYKKERYATLEEYKEYIKKSNKNYNLLELKDYSVKQYTNYTEFTCKDQYGDTYIFKDIGIMNYTLKLDDYTLKNDEFNKKYNGVDNKQKAKLNIDKFFDMINMKDYESAYKLLDTEFKEKNFNTVQKFEEYIKSKTFNHNRVVYNTYNDEMSPIYIYNITVKDIENEQSKEYNYQILVKLLEETNFVISINLN